MTRIPSVLLMVGVALGVLGTARAENWPQWRGPEGNGHVAAALPTEWSETSNIAWKTPLPKWGVSTPAVWGDAVLLTSQSEEGSLSVLRLSAADGKIVWTREVGKADTKREAEKRSVQKFHKLHNNASPSPVTDGKTVVVHFGNGDLIALDFAGEVLWKRNLQDDYGPYSIWWGHANSPVLFGAGLTEKLVISVCMQDTLEGAASYSGKPAANYVVAHELATGKLRWFTERKTVAQAEQCDSYTTPVFHKTGGGASGTEMVIMGGNQLDAYEPTTGKLRWHIGGLSGGRLITGPVVAGDYVFTTRGQKGEVLGVRLDEAARGADEADKAIVWRHKESTPDTCSPVVVDGRLFTIADSGIAQCLDAATGKELWKERLPGDYKASPITADGKIYFLNKEGLCTVVAAGPTFTKISENKLDDETLASPAAAGGKLFIRGRDHLYCVGKK